MTHVVGIEGELVPVLRLGVAEVSEEEYQRELLLGFINSIDPVALEALALGHMPGLDANAGGTGDAFLAALRELVTDAD